MKAIVGFISFFKYKTCSFCFEKLSHLISGTINVIVCTDDKIVAVLVSVLNVEKSQYKEFKGSRLFRFKICLLAFS